MVGFLTHWLITALALWATAYVIPGVHLESPQAIAIAALLLGLVNALVRPILFVLTLPITIMTLGLFYFVVNGIAFGLTAWLVPGFEVDGALPAIAGALMVSVISWFAGLFLKQAAKKD